MYTHTCKYIIVIMYVCVNVLTFACAYNLQLHVKLIATYVYLVLVVCGCIKLLTG